MGDGGPRPVQGNRLAAASLPGMPVYACVAVQRLSAKPRGAERDGLARRLVAVCPPYLFQVVEGGPSALISRMLLLTELDRVQWDRAAGTLAFRPYAWAREQDWHVEWLADPEGTHTDAGDLIEVVRGCRAEYTTKPLGVDDRISHPLQLTLPPGGKPPKERLAEFRRDPGLLPRRLAAGDRAAAAAAPPHPHPQPGHSAAGWGQPYAPAAAPWTTAAAPPPRPPVPCTYAGGPPAARYAAPQYDAQRGLGRQEESLYGSSAYYEYYTDDDSRADPEGRGRAPEEGVDFYLHVHGSPKRDEEPRDGWVEIPRSEAKVAPASARRGTCTLRLPNAGYPLGIAYTGVQGADGESVVVVGLLTDGPAHRAGVPLGATVEALGGMPVRTEGEFEQAIRRIRAAGAVEFAIEIRGGQIPVGAEAYAYGQHGGAGWGAAGDDESSLGGSSIDLHNKVTLPPAPAQRRRTLARWFCDSFDRMQIGLAHQQQHQQQALMAHRHAAASMAAAGVGASSGLASPHSADPRHPPQAPLQQAEVMQLRAAAAEQLQQMLSDPTRAPEAHRLAAQLAEAGCPEIAYGAMIDAGAMGRGAEHYGRPADVPRPPDFGWVEDNLPAAIRAASYGGPGHLSRVSRQPPQNARPRQLAFSPPRLT